MLMLEHHKANIPEQTYQKLIKEMQTNPQAVIDSYTQFLEKQRDMDIAKFADLSKEYSLLHHHDDHIKKKDDVANQLKELSKVYAADEKFQQAVERNDLTREVQYSLENDQPLNTSRGFER